MIEKATKMGATGVMGCSVAVYKEEAVATSKEVGPAVIKRLKKFKAYYVVFSGTAVSWESPVE